METRKRLGLAVLAAVILTVLIAATVATAGASETKGTEVAGDTQSDPEARRALVSFVVYSTQADTVSIGLSRRYEDGRWYQGFERAQWSWWGKAHKAYFSAEPGRYWYKVTGDSSQTYGEWVDVPPEGITVYVDLR